MYVVILCCQLLPFVLNLFSNQLLCGDEVTVSTLISMATVMTYI